MNVMTPIPVITGKLAGQSVPLVDARLLHVFLDVGRDYTTWIKDRIAEYEFIEGEDFICVAEHRDFSPNRWKSRLCKDLHCSKQTAWRRWRHALVLIVVELNGKPPRIVGT